MLSVLTADPVNADGGRTALLNGSAPRPFHIVARNPNTVLDAEGALQAGANAPEHDVTVAEPDARERNGNLPPPHAKLNLQERPTNAGSSRLDPVAQRS